MASRKKNTVSLRKPASAAVSPESKKMRPRDLRSSEIGLSELRRFRVVGVGASAGGLEALKLFLWSLPADTGMAFILVQHLDPNHESMSAEILSRSTRMPVTEVWDGLQVEPNHVYVIPSNSSMGILRGVLKLMPRIESRGPQTVIDYFFESLAKDQQDCAIGVVLSGTGSDGTQGLASIKAEGGVTLAQEPATAKFEDMPKNAIASGAVDLILSPDSAAKELAKIALHPLAGSAKERGPELDAKVCLGKIFQLLRDLCHVDFTLYKSNTLQRRIERRMVLHRIESLHSYSEFLSKHPDEVKSLYRDILIHVTSFFRDPDAFKALQEGVFPKLMNERLVGTPIRIWIPGCSTGEEPYSIAISLLEFLGEKAAVFPIQIFASDICEEAIQKARLGEYSESISREVSPERLERFFTRNESGNYKISKAVRDLCSFSRHDVTVDPPFAKIDLISCRNLLIYFTSDLQKHVMPIFHYALGQNGFLWLGRSETIGGFSNLFSLIDKGNKIYSRKGGPVMAKLQFPASTYTPGKQSFHRKASAYVKPIVDLHIVIDRVLQNEFPGVLVNEDMDILQYRGDTSPFIGPTPGAVSNHIFKMVRSELAVELRMAMQFAQRKNVSISKKGLSLKQGRSVKTFDLRVVPVKALAPSVDRYFLILFENATESVAPKAKKSDGSGKRGSSGQVGKDLSKLRRELTTSLEYQSALIEKYESAQQELTASNEELQSANEELQSTNEELETAKEELQSSNEELTTVNDELQSRSIDQIQLSNDLINLLGSVEIAILMIGSDRRIRRFTPIAGRALNILSSDVGRPISDLKFNFTAPGMDLSLDALISEVTESLVPKEIEVQDLDGRWFRLQVRPYKTLDNRIDGVVLAYVDIDALKQSLKEVKSAKGEAESANRSKDLFMATLSHELRTPLTAILSWAQMLRAGTLDQVKAQKGAMIIEESAKIQSQLISDLLDVSRIVAGKIALDIQETNIIEIVHAAMEAVAPNAADKSIRIEIKASSGIGTVMADPIRLQQVFWNLLSNAIKFSSPESRVIVRLERHEGENGERTRVLIHVEDSGKGIDPEFLPNIFERFSQQDSSSIRLHGGLGIGLTIVKNLVELHGGTVEAKSLGKDKGAIFSVCLPLRSRKPLPRLAEPRASQKPQGIRLDGVRILIVDDELHAGTAFAETLQSLGAQTCLATSVPQAIELFKQLRPVVLVSDIAMPNEDGYSLIKKIRALSPEQGGQIPALAVTAYAAKEDVQRALSAGFQLHLSKPVDNYQLAKAIRRLVEQSRK